MGLDPDIAGPNLEEIDYLKEELEKYKALSNNLIDASERMNLFQKSLEVLGLCKTTSGVMNTVVDMIQRIMPIEHYNVYQRRNDKWSLLEHSLKAPIIMNDSELDWTLGHPEPSVIPVTDALILAQDIHSYLLFPLRTAKSVMGCVVGWVRKKGGDLPQNLLRMLSALNAETAISLGNVQSNEHLRNMNTYLTHVLESLPQAVFTINREGEVKLFNHHAETIFEKQALLVIDEKIQTVLPKDFMDQIRHVIPQVLNGQKLTQLKIENAFSKESKNPYFSIDALPIQESDSKITGILFTMH